MANAFRNSTGMLSIRRGLTAQRGNAAQVFQKEFFGEPPPLRRVKVWSGVAWEPKPLKVRTAAGWQEKPLKVFGISGWGAG